MELSNPLYKNQGIHVITTLFTVEHGITKVLLVRRKNEPYQNMWSLVGGALYNNEDLEAGVKREVYEKTGIQDINVDLVNVFGKVDRSPIMRMIAISYISIIDSNKVAFMHETNKTSDADWFAIDNIPDLAYDHNEILESSLEALKEKIISSDILKTLFPNGFTIPEIQKVYEAILGRTFDRRNFRKKLLSLNLIDDANKYVHFVGKKPAKLYTFKEKIDNKKIMNF